LQEKNSDSLLEKTTKSSKSVKDEKSIAGIARCLLDAGPGSAMEKGSSPGCLQVEKKLARKLSHLLSFVLGKSCDLAVLCCGKIFRNLVTMAIE